MGEEEKENIHLILSKISVVLFRKQEQKVKNVRKEKDGPMRDSDARTISRTRHKVCQIHMLVQDVWSVQHNNPCAGQRSCPSRFKNDQRMKLDIHKRRKGKQVLRREEQKTFSAIKRTMKTQNNKSKFQGCYVWPKMSYRKHFI